MDLSLRTDAYERSDADTYEEAALSVYGFVEMVIEAFSPFSVSVG